MPKSKIVLTGLITILGIIMLILLAKGLFTISSQSLAQAAKSYNVTFSDNSSWFEIIPHNIKAPKTAVIFYPGALINPKSYVPKLAPLSHQRGIKIFIVKPIVRLAFLNPNQGGGIISTNSSIDQWYIGGHSMGGSVACRFAARHQSITKGLFLLASYCGKNERNFSKPTLTLAGANDPLDSASKLRRHLNTNNTLVVINGANHASFGSYGNQPFDGKQSVSDTTITKSLVTLLGSFIH